MFVNALKKVSACRPTKVIKSQDQKQVRVCQTNTVPFGLFKDQRSADDVRRQLSDLGRKINSVLRPVFTSKKNADEIKITEAKPPLVNQQCFVYV